MNEPLLSFELRGLPPTLNARRHWRVKYQQDKQWKQDVRVEVWRRFPSEEKLKAAGFPLKAAHIICTRFSSNQCDFDNLAASFKPVIDSLKELIIWDDNPNVLKKNTDYFWEKAPPGKGKIKVEVFKLEGGE
jgi:Holliday junction resolvase RusA-like endonuclease